MTPWFIITYAFGETTPLFLHVLNCTKEDTEHTDREKITLTEYFYDRNSVKIKSSMKYVPNKEEQALTLFFKRLW